MSRTLSRPSSAEGIVATQRPSSRASTSSGSVEGAHSFKFGRKGGFPLDLFLERTLALKFVCCICQNVAEKCSETVPCGHLFCGRCLSSARSHHCDSSARAFRCPVCQSREPSARASPFLDREVAALRVRCLYHSLGCDWSGCLSELLWAAGCHLSACALSPQRCDGCGLQVSGSELAAHKLKCATGVCPNCNTYFADASEGMRHVANCRPAVCCRQCGVCVSRPRLTQHLAKDCSERTVKCPYFEVGCVEPLKAKHLATHLRFNELTHVWLKLESVTASCNKQISALSTELAETKAKVALMSRTIPEVLVLRGSNRWEESGVFVKRSRKHCGRVCYVSLKSKCAIRWNPKTPAWFIDRRGLCRDGETSMIAYEDVLHPALVTGTWYVYNDVIGNWLKAVNYQIKGYSFAEFFLTIDKLAARHFDDADSGTPTKPTIQEDGHLQPPGFAPQRKA